MCKWPTIMARFTLTKEEKHNIRKEAVQRYTDTSWHIHKQTSVQHKGAKQSVPITNVAKKANGSAGAGVGGTLNGILKSNPNGMQKINNNDADSTNHNKIVDHETNGASGGQQAIDGTKTAVTAVTDAATVLLSNGDDTTSSARLNATSSRTHDESGRCESRSKGMMNGYEGPGGGGGGVFTSQPRASRHQHSPGTGMDLSFVTERIISLWFPASTNPHVYRQGQRQAAHMLRSKHADKYMVFNLSEPKRVLRHEHKLVKEVGWGQNLAPPLEKLCSICKEIDSWLAEDQQRIAVLHVRGNKDKLGVIVSAYMHYSSICGNAEQALDRFSMRKFLEDNVGPLTLPSNKRYVDYFAGLLSHNIKINAAPLYLTHVTVLGAPAFQQGGCRAFLKLYEGQSSIYTSGIYTVSSGVGQFTVNVAGERRRGLQLRGDILVKCYHRSQMGREAIFACQFHTCAVADYTLIFTKQDLDGACMDHRFPNDGAVELHFSAGIDGRPIPQPAPTPAVPFTPISDDAVTRCDSPFSMTESESEETDDSTDSDDVNHTFGPLDGSLYATIAKKPELSPGAVSSPLTVSMDSGISSAGHQQNANTAASGSPPPTAQASPLSPEEQHRELDELLSDMMLTVQSIPDVPSSTNVHHHLHNNTNTSSSNNFNCNNNSNSVVIGVDHHQHQQQQHLDGDAGVGVALIPYHARQSSRPFTYGMLMNDGPPQQTSSATHSTPMMGSRKNTNPLLASPSLVRKVSAADQASGLHSRTKGGMISTSCSSPLGCYESDGGDGGVTSLVANHYQNNHHNAVPNRINHRPQDLNGNLVTSLKRSYTESSISRTTSSTATSNMGSAGQHTPTQYYTATVSSPYTDTILPPTSSTYRIEAKPQSPDVAHETYNGNGTIPNHSKNLTWLQKQQLKLKERREMQLREERYPHETRLITELRQVQNRHRKPTASHRLDGYTSDTTAFADDDEDYTIPLHINTVTSKGPPPPQQQQQSMFKETNITTTTNSPSTTMDGHHQQSFRRTHQDSWRSTDILDSSAASPRPQTPAFPVHNNRSPYTNASTPTVQFNLSTTERLPPKSPTTQRKDRPTSPNHLSNGSATTSVAEYFNSTGTNTIQRNDSFYQQHQAQIVSSSPKNCIRNGSASPTTIYYTGSRRSSVHSNSEPPQEVAPANVKFVRDTSKFWYKPTITRDEAISLLRDRPAGTFVVRDSNSFPGAFGLALRVSHVPPNLSQMQHNSSSSSSKSSSKPGDELIRHFLIEPTSRGVRLKGCPSEPVFSSLSALIYQHSVTPLALPCRLVLPDVELQSEQIMSTLSTATNNTAQRLLMQGAACNVLYLWTADMESLTGPEAVRKAVAAVVAASQTPDTAVVHFKVNGQGITLTDNQRKLFFRKHYPIGNVSHCGLDPEERRWAVRDEQDVASQPTSNRIFGFVARKLNASNPDNQCHLFVELEPEQPASAIVNFVNKMLTSSGIKTNIV